MIRPFHARPLARAGFALAALAMLSASSSFECQYVGTLPTAKQFGDMPLYALRRKVSVGRR